MSQNAKHTPGPWQASKGGSAILDSTGHQIAYTLAHDGDRPYEANARLIAASPGLLAYAECEAAIACGRADPRYDPKPVLSSHGWNEQTESAGLFLARIRRKAFEEATGGYLGRAA
ncbi:hypothetical protein P12x_005300 [Tundrisphaera lichenicola]|uniref:hypothetical protein n=1 Tax=Tundrisphaera lichenicola TaxID=2029860 RepID=UPI003EBEAFF4